MLRCPFNNFSKCDGSCPFSTDNFTACMLAVNGLQAAGRLAGVLSKLDSLIEKVDEIDNLVTSLKADAGESQGGAVEDDQPLTTEEYVKQLGRDHFIGMTTRGAYSEYISACEDGVVDPEDLYSFQERFTKLVNSTHSLHSSGGGGSNRRFYDPKRAQEVSAANRPKARAGRPKASSKKAAGHERSRAAERASMEQIQQMPALLSTDDYSRITGESPLYIAKLCSQGKLPAVKSGRKWLINKARALEAIGISV